jgi:hypothetical protein
VTRCLYRQSLAQGPTICSLLMRRLELYSAVQNTDHAIDWCRSRGLLIADCGCPVCASPMKEERDRCQDGRIWRCRRTIAGCRHQTCTSIRHNSIFSQSRLALKDALYLLYEWSIKTGAAQASFELAISEKTVREYYKLLRGVAHNAINRLPTQIGGERLIVEIDECQIGRRKAHRGRVPREIWIFGGIERESVPLKCFIEIVGSRSQETLVEVIRRRIHPLSKICSDGWRAYSCLQSLGFTHGVVNHSENFLNPNDLSVHTQNIENLWCCLRRFLRSKGTYTRKNLLGYLDEFIFRKSYIDPFDTIVSVAEEMLRARDSH